MLESSGSSNRIFSVPTQSDSSIMYYFSFILYIISVLQQFVRSNGQLGDSRNLESTGSVCYSCEMYTRRSTMICTFLEAETEVSCLED